jgi:hypothetical protein
MWVLASFLLAAFASGSTSRSEELVLAMKIRETPHAKSAHLLAALREEVPDSNWTVEMVKQFRITTIKGSFVPKWLHDELWKFDTLSASHEDIPRFVAAVISVAPIGAPAMYKDPEVLSIMIPNWITFCINKLKQFPETKSCAERVFRDHSGETQTTMALDSTRFFEYMSKIISDLFGRTSQRKRSPTSDEGVRVKRRRTFKGRKVAGLASTTIAPTHTPIAWETEPSSSDSADVLTRETRIVVEKLVLGQLVSNPSGSVEIEEITQRQTQEIIASFRLYTEIPYRLHEVMFRYRDHCSLENRNMMEAIEEEVRPAVPREYLEAVIPVWRTFCIEPLVSFFKPGWASFEIPCVLNSGKRTMVLTEQSLKNYFSILLASYQ